MPKENALEFAKEQLKTAQSINGANDKRVCAVVEAIAFALIANAEQSKRIADALTRIADKNKNDEIGHL